MLRVCHPDHAARYEFASRYVQGCDVLDAGCGFGYGSSILSAAATTVTGLDPYEPGVEYARRHYPNCCFLVGELESIDLPNQSFGAVVSLETIEHVRAPVRFLDRIRELLAPDGILVISSPNALVTSREGVLGDPTHLREYTPDQFRELLIDAGFENVTLFGVHVDITVWHRHAARSRLGRLDRLNLRRLLPVPIKARIIALIAPTRSSWREPVEITSDVALGDSQIAVARAPSGQT